MTQNVSDLRDILFTTIAGIKDGSLPLDKAKAINEVARTLVDTARAENDHLKITQGTGSDFMGKPDRPLLPGEAGKERTGTGTKTVTALPGGATVTQHRMRG